MHRDYVTLYPGHAQGALKANRVGAIVRLGRTFDIIRPGYDAQGRRRIQWTQFVHEGVPVYEVKLRTDLSNVLDKFDQTWAKTIGPDEDLFERALKATKRERLAKYRDGVSGESPAPAVTKDGRNEGRKYPS